ncbi:hypothetical protein [Devosia sp. 1566]|uniref:hypothetical protein n=1 Tax=Devosia sp. 1566 TaxID=2499144 RepID=UPI000FD90B78|nr:hypothetical protein [Devosia sp. 1566]
MTVRLEHRNTAGSGTGERLWLVLPLLFAVGVVIGIVPFLTRHGFYYNDDMQFQFMPIFYHIGRLLRAGEFPYLTLHSWWGSNIAAEFQFAIYNPVSLALYAILPSIQDFEAAAAFQACFYYGVLTSGTYVLARSFGLEMRWAWLVAITMACSNFLSYWAASNWFPIFSSSAWLVWSWALLRMAPRSRLHFLGAVLFSYLTISSGFPHTILMLGFVCLLTIYEQWRERGWRVALAAPAAVLAATLLAALPLLGVLGTGGAGDRQNHIYNADFLTPNLRDLLQISSASHLGFMNIYGGFGRVQVPIFYLAWFIVPMMALLNWRRIDWTRPALAALLAFSGFMLFVMQGPEQLLMIRYFLRWLPYLHLAMLLVFCLMVQQAGLEFTRRRILISVLLLLLVLVGSLQVTPNRALVHLAFAVISCVGLGLFLLTRRRPGRAVAVLVGVGLALFVGTHLLITRHGNFGELNTPRQTSTAMAAFSALPPETYSLSLGAQGNEGRDLRLERFSNGYTFLESGLAMINGYSSIGHRGLDPILCFNWRAETCPESAVRVVQSEPETGAPYLDLFRVDEITVAKDQHLEKLRPLLGREWTMVQDGQFGQRFERNLSTMPGTLSWLPAGATAEQASQPRLGGELLNVRNSTAQSAPLVFARLWWPGYRARFNGEFIPVRALDGIFVAVDLPPGATGTLELFFWPPRQTLGLMVSAMGALLAMGVSLAHPRLFGPGRRTRRLPSPQ